MKARFRLLLIGNYRADRQQSMLRYAEVLERHLPAQGVPVAFWFPPHCFGRLSTPGRPLFKWLAYLDKYLLFPALLAIGCLFRRWQAIPTVVHLCDHSNSPYVSFLAGLPSLTTCHDVGAIRGAFGDLDDCPATGLGVLLQRAIMGGLRRSGWIACVSEATRRDLLRWVAPPRPERVRVIHNGLNQTFAHSAEETRACLELLRHDPGLLDRPYLLNVGSGLARKNREGVMRIFAEFKKDWPGRLVFVGEALSPALLRLRDSLGLAADDLRHIDNPSSLLLEACYRHAFALLFPTRFEGFGWPVIEAQACGCPVLTTTVSALPEVAGAGACLRDPGDEAGFLTDLRALREPSFREEIIARGHRNAERFTTAEMISRFLQLYEEIACAS